MKNSQHPGTENFLHYILLLFKENIFTSWELNFLLWELNFLLIVLCPSIVLAFIKESFIFLLEYMVITITLIMKITIKIFYLN